MPILNLQQSIPICAFSERYSIEYPGHLKIKRAQNEIDYTVDVYVHEKKLTFCSVVVY